MERGQYNIPALPVGIESFEKYERKAAKLKDSLELELEERMQVDNVLNFFQDSSKNFLDDDAFYRLDDVSGSGTTATQKRRPLISKLFLSVNGRSEHAHFCETLEPKID